MTATHSVPELDAMPAAAFAEAVAPLFEGAPRFLARLAAARPFGDVTDLFTRARSIAHAMPEPEQLELIDAHPRLGAQPGSVSALSFVEQGYHREAADAAAEVERTRVADELERLNAAYESRFGFRYCVFVAGRPRAELLPGMTAALGADRASEIARALDAVVDIAADRYAKLTTPGARRSDEMTIEMGPNRYGKARVRLVKVIRLPDRHVVRDLTVRVALEGDFADAHVTGDNSLVIATDTMKNTVYALAKDGLTGSIEAFGTLLAGHFLLRHQVERSTIWIAEHAWDPIVADGSPAPDAFLRNGSLTRTATVTAEASGVTVEGGVEDMSVMKTDKSAFAGFPRDRYTTLADTDDRIMATKVTATWRYGAGAIDLDHDAAFERVMATFMRTFAEHFSPSVQNSIWVIGRAILEAEPAIDEIRFALPNLHHWMADLRPFGMDNDREIFVATTEPHGLIEATVRRSD